jgi:protease II
LSNSKDYYQSINKDYKLFCIHDKDINKDILNLLIAPDNDEYFEDMDIFKDYLIIYLKKSLVPYILLHNIKTGENSRHRIGEPGEVQPCLNKVFIINLEFFIKYS